MMEETMENPTCVSKRTSLSLSSNSNHNIVSKRQVFHRTASSLLVLNMTLLLMGSTYSTIENGMNTSTGSNMSNSNGIIVNAFVSPNHSHHHSNLMGIFPTATNHNHHHCTHPIRSGYVASERWHWSRKKLYSTTPQNDIEQNNNPNQSHYLSKFPTIKLFNDYLQIIANECTDTRNVKFDILSRATTTEKLVLTLASDPNAPYQPNTSTFNTLLKIWAKAAHVLAEGNGRGTIDDFLHDDLELNTGGMKDVVISDDLKIMLNGGKSVCSASDAANHANSILSFLETKYLKREGVGYDRYGGNKNIIQPNCRGYNIVMDGWNKSRARNGAERIQTLFLKMKKLSTKGYEVGDYDDDNDSEDYDDSDDTSSFVHTDAADWESIRPNAVTYSITIESFRRKSFDNKIGDIDTLLKDLEQLYEEMDYDPNFKPDIGIANAMIKSCMRSADYKSGGGGKRQQSMVTMSWKTAKKINEIYNKWNKKFKKTQDSAFKPNVVTSTMVIEAYARCGDIVATQQAQAIFEKMIKDWTEGGDDSIKPNSKTFTAIVTAWAKTKDPRSPEMAESLIAQMEEMYAEELKQGIQNSQLSPHSQTYTAAITAWARSRDNTKAQRGLRLLKKASDMYKETKDKRIQPTLFTYNAAIDACAKCYGASPEIQTNALKIAFAVNKAISAAHLQGNHVTYGTLLKAVNSLMVPGDQKNEIVQAVFNKCKKEGYVDTTVMKTLKLTADQDMFHSLLDEAKDKTGRVDFDLVPPEWSRNIKK